MTETSSATAALEAIAAGDRTALEALLKADPQLAAARDRQGVSLLMQAIYRQQRELVALLLERGAPIDAFAAAALGDLAELRSQLAATPALLAEFSPDGFTLLHLAAFFGQTELVGELLSCGANAGAVANNAMQVQPLHSAVALRQWEAARLLVAAGADVNARQQGGWTPLHAAAAGGDLAIAQLLLDHGADPRRPNDQGVDALALAQSKGHAEVAALLAGRAHA
ncbi:MAG: ankyrin repeat domain-containing protein [Pirellulales bacterium]